MKHKALITVLAAVIALIFATPCIAGGFDDVPQDHWAYNAVQYLTSKGVLEGDEWGMFNGDHPISRYEFAVAVARMMGIIEDLEAAGGYDVDGEMKELTGDIYAIIEELEDEFSEEIEAIYEILEIHAGRIETLEEDVEEIRTTVEDVENKVGKIKWGADLRLRFEAKYKNNNSQVLHPRARFRVKLEGPINDEIKLKGRFASGSNANPNSTNQTFDDEFEKRYFWIDRMYLEWTPSDLEEWSFFAGKFPPNWKNSLVTFDSDINVEGIGQSYASSDGWVLNFAELIPDKEGFYIIAQIGMEDLFTEGLDGYLTWHFINDQAWQHIAQKLEDGDLFNHMQLDRIDMDSYSAIDFLGKFSWDTGGTPMSIECNYVLNLADDAQPGLSGLQQAAWARLKINKARELGDIEGWIEYGKLQSNSVLSFLTDADRGCGDNAFWGAGLKYKWMKNMDIAFLFVYADRLSTDESYKLFQLDFLAKV